MSENTAMNYETNETSYLFPAGMPKRKSRKNSVGAAAVKTAAPVRALRVVNANSQDLGTSWFWGAGPALADLRNDLDHSLKASLNVLIVGETGTGKEIIAQKIHSERRRNEVLSEDNAPFVSINCATIPEALAESILFGHERGAFTSARERQIGKFELAKRGTLFLDEVQSLPLELQVKLLRALQQREVERLGGRLAYKVECKIVAATNVPLELLVEQKKFRKDLYYRLNICPLYLPALRHRKQDFPVIIKGLLAKVCAEAKIAIPEVSSDAFELLLAHTWPGNIRELEHALTYAVIRADGPIEISHLPGSLTGKLHKYVATGEWL